MQDLFLTDYTIFLRIFAACALGFSIGLERELTNKYAGLRTHILVCLGACVFTILSIYAFPQAVDNTNPQAYGDPARIAAQIVTGIGFIGGGTVMKHGSSVYGLTTAATLWMAASIGMACGAGSFDVAIIATLMSVITLVLVKFFERDVLVKSTKNFKKIKIRLTCQDKATKEVHTFITDNFPKLHEVSQKPSDADEGLTKIVAVVDINSKNPIQDLYKNFENINGIESISIQDADD